MEVKALHIFFSSLSELHSCVINDGNLRSMRKGRVPLCNTDTVQPHYEILIRYLMRNLQYEY